MPNEGHKHVYVTLVGEQGGMQDLRLRFVTKQPEPVKIYFKDPHPLPRMPLVTKEGEQNNAEKGKNVEKKQGEQNFG